MKAEVVEGWPKDNKIRIVLSDTNAAQVNSLRRAILADVPKMAITKVRFEQGVTQDNKGEVIESVNVLPDEVLAHRLAMVPVPTFLEEFVFPEDDPNNENLPEDQWGSPLSQIIYHLSIRGPNSDSADEVKTVYAGDLNVLGETKLQIKEEHSKIPLTILSKGQYLELYAYATLGRGRDHAKWCPAAAVTFQPRQKAVLAKPKKANVLFDLNLTSRSGRAINSKLFTNKECTDVDSVLDLERALQQVGYGTGREDDFDNAIVMEDIEGEYVFSFESDGSMPAEEIFNRACEELVSRFEKITGEIDAAFA
ncbi:MAG: DNA-directed RNA polymerase subunit D [Candidatus Thermoplasmatota archaeon]|jgi:DNA-directed RNA polymerase subunit D|nr:DNA-directed RNA polymerase subunit D [Candidatus Thermoplasmatota archaeon]MEC8789451.1 DNA-directed RNA polymerase subunit D [Candidatus Thermoplasmatota archaeon]